MTNTRKPLDFGSLDDFETRPKPQSTPRPATQKAVDRLAAFPSREAADDAQMNIKASAATLDRFRTMAKAERYKHGEFLEILMDAYERR